MMTAQHGHLVFHYKMCNAHQHVPIPILTITYIKNWIWF